MWRKAIIFKIITVSLVIFIVLLSCAAIINLIKLSRVNARQEYLKTQLEKLEQEYILNAEELDYKQTAEYIEYYARRYLEMKGKGETAFTGE